MKRRAFDSLVSVVGLFLAAILVVAGSLLTWAHNFVTDEVHSQLSAQQIYFPPEGSDAIAGDEYAPVRQYAGQQLTTGAQAKVYADSFIGNHLKKAGGGLTYAQLSTKAQANPDDKELAAKVATMFKGETLRGLLLNAYAFGTMGTIAGIAALTAFIGGAVLLLLAGLGLWHSRRTSPDAEIRTVHPPGSRQRLTGPSTDAPVPAPRGAGALDREPQYPTDLKGKGRDAFRTERSTGSGSDQVRVRLRRGRPGDG